MSTRSIKFNDPDFSQLLVKEGALDKNVSQVATRMLNNGFSIEFLGNNTHQSYIITSTRKTFGKDTWEVKNISTSKHWETLIIEDKASKCNLASALDEREKAIDKKSASILMAMFGVLGSVVSLLSPRNYACYSNGHCYYLDPTPNIWGLIGSGLLIVVGIVAYKRFDQDYTDARFTRDNKLLSMVVFANQQKTQKIEIEQKTPKTETEQATVTDQTHLAKLLSMMAFPNQQQTPDANPNQLMTEPVVFTDQTPFAKWLMMAFPNQQQAQHANPGQAVIEEPVTSQTMTEQVTVERAVFTNDTLLITTLP